MSSCSFAVKSVSELPEFPKASNLNARVERSAFIEFRGLGFRV